MPAGYSILNMLNYSVVWFTDIFTWPRSYKTFFVLSSAEHEILNAHKYRISINSAFSGSTKPRMLVFLLKNVTIVGIFIFMSSKKFMLS